MRVAISEARKGTGRTSPNPLVGAVLVRDGRIAGRGFHRRAGEPHAEVVCLKAAKAIRPTDILYVTLEPCSTSGRTGACTNLLISAGVRHVVVGAIDPNPHHSGRGLEILKAAGIAVTSGVLGDECTAMNEAFNKWITTGMPLVIAKCGMSLDGRLTKAPGEDRWITSAASRRDAQKLRASVDAILIGAETLRLDDPRLTVRAIRGAQQPWRVIVGSSRKLPKTARVFNDAFAGRTIVLRGRSLRANLRALARHDITSVLIEGGGEILGAALDERLIDRVQVYIGPMFTSGNVMAFAGRGAGSTGEAARLERVACCRIGNDVRVTACVKYPGAEIAA